MPRDIQAIVEEQIQRWRAAQANSQAHPEEPLPRPNVITIAHALGANGVVIAERAGAILGMPVFDREIVTHIAERADIRVETAASLDERARGRVTDYLSSLQRERNFDHDDFTRHLVQTVAALWEHGPCLLLGHGCVHVVPRSHALSIHITAPEWIRLARVAPRLDLHRDAILRYLQRNDAERIEFHRRAFGVNVDDQGNYDLVLDSSAFDVEGCAGVIVEAYRRKFSTVASYNHDRPARL